MARFDPRILALAATLVSAGLGCTALVDESNRPCPCSSGYQCCNSTCVAEGTTCGEPPEAATADAPSDSQRGDAEAASAGPDGDAPLDVAMGCAVLPPPVVHFAFTDCSDAGIVRDTAGSSLGLLQGSGVQCDRSPVGGALRFDGVDDGGGGSYVRVVDALDASPPVCGDAGECPPQWRFGSAITVSVLLDIADTQAFENILGQWYLRDSYIFNTFYDPNTSQQLLRFSVQPAGAPQPVNVWAPTPVSLGSTSPAWSHWVGVYDGTTASLYQDGQRVSTQPLDGGGGPLQCTDVPLELGLVGQGPCADLGGFDYRGGIGDVQIFDVALTADQVRSLDCQLGWAR